MDEMAKNIWGYLIRCLKKLWCGSVVLFGYVRAKRYHWNFSRVSTVLKSDLKSELYIILESRQKEKMFEKGEDRAMTLGFPKTKNVISTPVNEHENFSTFKMAFLSKLKCNQNQYYYGY